ncbi:hypothetical protein [Streptomyces olivaceiscleroticus]|uniref:Uncharacterized protein n=1 Tax=Streptomyces olivaceiscleroticus TaxID=68245 RepID=A0ABN1BNP3_9ACTN
MTQTTPPEEQGTHFWFMTFLARTDRDVDVANRSGTWTPPPGFTRFDAMKAIRQQLIEDSPHLANSAMLSFDIQPNQL